MTAATEPSSEFVDRPWMEGACAPDTSADPDPAPPIPGPRAIETDQIWLLACHLGPVLLWFAGPFYLPPLAPLLIWQLKAKPTGDPRLTACAVEALNFQISLVLITVLLTITILGAVLIPLLAVMGFLLPIIAGIHEYQGKHYRYPGCIRLVRE